MNNSDDISVERIPFAKIPNRRFTKSDQRLLGEVAKRVDSLRPGLLEKADKVFAIPDKCKPHRASKDLKLLRTLTLAELLIEGWNWSQLLPHAAERWGVNERQLRTYFREAEASLRRNMRGGEKPFSASSWRGLIGCIRWRLKRGICAPFRPL